MAAKTGEVKVKLIGDNAGLKKTLINSNRSILGFSTKAVLGFTSVVTSLGGLGLAAMKLGGSFDNAFDKIAIKTVATGGTLDGLNESFKTVFGSVPTDMNSAATAIADLHTGLGLTGTELETFSINMLKMTKLLDGDLDANIRGSIRMFGDWGVGVDEQSDTLDRLFVLQQTTGIGYGRLSDQMVKYGAPLRSFGFDMEQAAAMMAKFEKEGVNTELVMGAFRESLSRLARAGEEPADAFARVTEAIKSAGTESEANLLAIEMFGAVAGPDMSAAIREGRFEIDELVNSLGDTEGAIGAAEEKTRSWQESFQILKNKGMVAIEPLVTKVFTLAGDAMDWILDLVEKHGDSVKSFFVDTWGAVKRIFSDFMASPEVKGLREAFGELADAFSSAFGSGSADSARSFSGHLKNIFSVIVSAITVVIKVAALLMPVFKVLFVVAAAFVKLLAALIRWIVLLFDKPGEAFRQLWELIKQGLKALPGLVLSAIGFLVKNVLKAIGGLVVNIPKALSSMVKLLASAFVKAVPWVLRGVGRLAKSIIEGLWNFLKKGIPWVAGKFADGLKAVLSKINPLKWFGGEDVAAEVGGGYYDAGVSAGESFSLGLADVSGDFEQVFATTGLAGLEAFSGGMHDGIDDFGGDLGDEFKLLGESLGDSFGFGLDGSLDGLPGELRADGRAGAAGLAAGMASASGKVFAESSKIGAATVKGMRPSQTFLRDLGIGAVGAYSSGIGSQKGRAGSVAGSVAGRVVSALGGRGLLDRLYGFGADLIRGLQNGIEALAPGLLSRVSSIASSISSSFRRILGIRSPSKVFEGFGANIMEGLSAGIERGANLPVIELDTVANSLQLPALPSTAVAAAPSFGLEKGDGQVTNVTVTVNMLEPVSPRQWVSRLEKELKDRGVV